MSTPKPAVCVYGASTKTDRPSYVSVTKWLAAGYEVWPVHPSGLAVAGQTTYRSLADLPGTPMLISVYVNPDLGIGLVPEWIDSGAQYVWLNPGTMRTDVAEALEAGGVKVITACNLVALSQGDPFERMDYWLTATY